MQYVQNVFSWLNDVFLEMTWLSDLITWIVNNIFRLPINDESTIGKIGGSIQFFMYDFVKIMALLCVLIFMLIRNQSLAVVVLIKATLSYG